VRDLTYPPIILTAKLAFKALGLKFDMRGAEHVPRSGGALMVFNHVSYVDFILGGLAAHPSDRLVRFMAKREVFDHRFGGPVMRSMHHIAVDRAEGVASFDEAVRYLREGQVVGIFPRPRSPAASSSRSSRPARRGWPPRPAYP
jgi:1-acyl-sn-glycerol-3-phosphate acyltransferase